MLHLRQKSKRRQLYFRHSSCQFNGGSAQDFCQKCVCLDLSKIELNVSDDFTLDSHSSLPIQLLCSIIIVICESILLAIWKKKTEQNWRPDLNIFTDINDSIRQGNKLDCFPNCARHQVQYRSLSYTAWSLKMPLFLSLVHNKITLYKTCLYVNGEYQAVKAFQSQKSLFCA